MSTHKFFWQGKRVLITGGASGIGKMMGRLVLEKGSRLFIWDVNQKGIDAVLNEFAPYGEVQAFQVDVSKPEQIEHVAGNIKEEFGGIDVLINNAGVVTGKYFHEHSTGEILRTMEVNADAPMLVAKAFLGGMLERNSGSICNIASLAGMISNPQMSVYAASKWAVIGWSDSLRLEMEKLKKEVHVTTIMPYYIDTGMFDGVKSRVIPILKPEKVSRAIIRAIEKKKIMRGIPLGYRALRFWQGVLNIKGFDWLVGKRMGVYKTMEYFTGRKS